MGWSDPAGLLDGTRVVSFGTFVAGNVCALILAELGADVIKVESPHRPEALRSYDYPGQPQPTEPSGMRTTAVFAGLSRSVRSVAIDLETPGGQRLGRDLIGRADVLVENLQPGVLAAWGCDPGGLQAAIPALVSVSISGYGRTGPMAGYRAYASNIGNFTGLTAAWGPDGTYLDFLAGLQAAHAVTAGLAHARRTGEGARFDLAQTEAGVALLAPLYLGPLNGAAAPGPVADQVPGAVLAAVVRCSGGDRWLAVELEDAADRRVLADLLERPDLAGPEPHPEGDPLVDVLSAWAAELTPRQAALRLQGAGLAAAPVQDTEDLWSDPQHRARGAWVEIDHPDLGSHDYPGPVGRASGTPARLRRRGPRLGEHTAEVLGEWLELDGSSLDRVRAEGAAWLPGPGGTGLPIP